MTAEMVEAPAKKAAKAVKVAPEPEKDDLDIILPVDGVIVVAGVHATVRRLKTREFLSLMRVLTNGLGPGLAEVKFSTDDKDAMQQEMMALFMLAIPNAIEDFGLFMLQIVDPVDEKDAPVLMREMENPDPDVLIDILVVLSEQEKDDLFALLGKGRAALSHIQGIYQPKK